MALSMLRAYFFGTGPGTVVPGGLHAFIKTRPELAVPDIEFMFRAVPPQTRICGSRCCAPAYHGRLRHPPDPAASAKAAARCCCAPRDPHDPPRIVYNFFSGPDDLPRLRDAFKRARDVGEQSADGRLSRRRDSPGRARSQTDDEIDAFIRRTAITAHHPARTCRMGSDDRRVLDPRSASAASMACASSTRRPCPTSSPRTSMLAC